MTERQPESLEDEQQRRFRRIFAWVFVLCTLGICVVVLFFVIKSAFLSYGKPGPLLGISPELATFLRDHFSVTVGLPFAAVVSLLVILVLRETTGKLEFEAIGFKFRGASGPVVLWVLCYLAITLSIKLLW
jgi:hypothetical protein